jgi:hypothetical protein
MALQSPTAATDETTTPPTGKQAQAELDKRDEADKTGEPGKTITPSTSEQEHADPSQ